MKSENLCLKTVIKAVIIEWTTWKKRLIVALKQLNRKNT